LARWGEVRHAARGREAEGSNDHSRQVLLNLITNAIDAMVRQDGARVLRVRSMVREPDGVMVSVEDTGRGIEPAHIERIFSPHFTTKSK
jgi:C4-dicarboxylate-specific signal transduction histidine kinase